MHRRRFLSLPLALLLPTLARADDPPPQKPEDEPEEFERDPLPQLAAMLAKTRWTPGAAKTLLTFSAEATPPAPEFVPGFYGLSYYLPARRQTLGRLGPPPFGGYSLPAVAAAYARQVRRFGTVAALTRLTYPYLNENPAPAILNALNPENLSPDEFVNRLDDALLQRLMSLDGLGRDDVPPALRPRFDALIPPALKPSDDAPIEELRVLTDDERRNARLRITLATSIFGVTVAEDAPGARILAYEGRQGTPDGDLPDGDFLRPDYRRQSQSAGKLPERALAFGRWLVLFKGPREKPSDLRLTACQKRVSLEGVQTLDALAQRISVAENIALYIPPWLGPNKLMWRGEPSAASGDLLAAIAAYFGGTFRKVGEAFVFAANRKPLGPSFTRLNLWHEDARRRETASPHRREFLPMEWSRFEPGEFWPLNQTWRERLADADPLRGVTVPVETFPDSSRLLAARRARTPNLQVSHLSIQCVGKPHLLLRDTEPVTLDGTFRVGRPSPTPAAPLNPKVHWPLVRVETEEEARRAVMELAKRGFLSVTLDGPLAALRAALATKKLTIWAVTRLLAPTPDDDPDLLERNVFGEVQPFLSPTSPEAVALAGKRLKTLAQLPGLAGLLLRDALPPGYRSDVEGDSGFDDDPLAIGGYTERNRRAFLAEHRCDPFDLSPNLLCLAVSEAYFYWAPEESESNTWRIWRAKQGWRALDALQAELKKQLPRLPMFLQGGPPDLKPTYRTEYSPGWFEVWTPRRQDTDLWGWLDREARAEDSGRWPGKNRHLRVSARGCKNRAELERRLGDVQSRLGDGWRGRFLDLTDRPLDDALALLGAVE